MKLYFLVLSSICANVSTTPSCRGGGGRLRPWLGPCLLFWNSGSVTAVGGSEVHGLIMQDVIVVPCGIICGFMEHLCIMG